MGKVLIIDDEKQILGLLSRIIGLEGYDVFQASTCRAGLKQLEQHTPEVILCDVDVYKRQTSPRRPSRKCVHWFVRSAMWNIISRVTASI